MGEGDCYNEITGLKPMTWRAQIFLGTCLILLLFVRPAVALIPRNVSVDVGFGIPHLIFGQGIVKISDHWQMGVGYGLIPGAAAAGKGIKLDDQVFALQDGTEVGMTPVLNLNFNTLLPFIRYFPRDNNFYVQATYAMLQLGAEISGTLKTNDALGATVGLVTGTATITQPVPTLSVGHVWAGKVYFCDLSLGLSFFLPASASITLKSLIPDALGGSEGNETAINQLGNDLASQLNDNTGTYRDQFPVLPSLSLTFGIML